MHHAGPALSIAIAYYRGPDYLREAIDSVLAQTFDDWELVVVDDRGPEPPRARRGEPTRGSATCARAELGLAGNWNECVRRASAPYVTVLHGDDRLLPRYGETVLAALEDTQRRRRPSPTPSSSTPTGVPRPPWPTRSRSVSPPAEDHLLSGDDDLAGLLRGNYIVCPDAVPAPLARRVGTVRRRPPLRPGLGLHGARSARGRQPVGDPHPTPGVPTALRQPDVHPHRGDLALHRGDRVPRPMAAATVAAA